MKSILPIKQSASFLMPELNCMPLTPALRVCEGYEILTGLREAATDRSSPHLGGEATLATHRPRPRASEIAILNNLLTPWRIVDFGLYIACTLEESAVAPEKFSC